MCVPGVSLVSIAPASATRVRAGFAGQTLNADQPTRTLGFNVTLQLGNYLDTAHRNPAPAISSTHRRIDSVVSQPRSVINGLVRPPPLVGLR